MFAPKIFQSLHYSEKKAAQEWRVDERCKSEWSIFSGIVFSISFLCFLSLNLCILNIMYATLSSAANICYLRVNVWVHCAGKAYDSWWTMLQMLRYHSFNLMSFFIWQKINTYARPKHKHRQNIGIKLWFWLRWVDLISAWMLLECLPSAQYVRHGIKEAHQSANKCAMTQTKESNKKGKECSSKGDAEILLAHGNFDSLRSRRKTTRCLSYWHSCYCRTSPLLKRIKFHISSTARRN